MAYTYHQNEITTAGDGSSDGEHRSSQLHHERSNSDTAEHNCQETNDTTSSIAGAPFHYIPTSAAPTNPALATATPFTIENLATHEQQHQHQVESMLDLAEMQCAFEDRVETLCRSLLQIGVQVPEHVLNDMAYSYDGMIPIERFLAEYEDSHARATTREEEQALGTEHYRYPVLNDEDFIGWQEG